MCHLRFVYGCNPAVETAFFDLKSQMEKKITRRSSRDECLLHLGPRDYPQGDSPLQ